MKKGTKITLSVIGILTLFAGMWAYMTGKIDNALKSISANDDKNETDKKETGWIPSGNVLGHASFPLSRGSKTRSYGSKGIEVKRLQEYLNFTDWLNTGKKETGFIDTDGYYGNDTLQLVLKYNLPKEISTDYYDNVVIYNLKKAEKTYNRKFEK